VVSWWNWLLQLHLLHTKQDIQSSDWWILVMREPGSRGNLCIPWPGIAIWGNHQNIKTLIFGGYLFYWWWCFTRWGYYRITCWRYCFKDIILVPLRGCYKWTSCSCWKCNWFSSWYKGNALYGYVILKETGENKENLFKEILIT
jgi:acetyl-CoA synthetase